MRPSSVMRSGPCRSRCGRAMPGSSPRITFSSTVRLSASMKCWCTMPMPTAMASRGDLKLCSTPRTGSFPRPAAARRRGSSSASTCRRRSPRRSRGSSPAATARSMPSLATTPGNRLTMPLQLDRGAVRPVGDAPGAPSDEAAAPPRARSWTVLYYIRLVRLYGAVGTMILPSMICGLRSSSLVMMSSRLPPVVE